MDVHWTVPYVLHGTEGRDRQWDLRCKQGTYGCPLDCPVCPTWYRELDRNWVLRSKQGTWVSTGLSYISFVIQRDGIHSGI